jgi:hypothetical protein
MTTAVEDELMGRAVKLSKSETPLISILWPFEREKEKLGHLPRHHDQPSYRSTRSGLGDLAQSRGSLRRRRFGE